MDKNKKRGDRRDEKQRAFDKAYKVGLSWNVNDPRYSRQEWARRFAHRHAKNMAKCSCFMCGNPRRHYGGGDYSRLTIQERKILEDGFSQVEDLEEG